MNKVYLVVGINDDDTYISTNFDINSATNDYDTMVENESYNYIALVAMRDGEVFQSDNKGEMFGGTIICEFSFNIY